MCFLHINNGFGQNFTLKKKILTTEITNIHYNRYSDIFVTDEKGNITAFNESGDTLKNYSTERPFQCSQLNAFNHLQIFLFSEPDQSYIWVDRQLSTSNITTLQQKYTGYVSACNVSSDGQLWIIDQDAFLLKKFNPSTLQNSITVPLLSYEINEIDNPLIIEHQNKLYFKNQNTIYVLDLFGNVTHHFQCHSSNTIHLYNNFLLILENEHSIRKKDIYLNTNSVIELPIEKIKNFIWINKTLVLVTEESIYFYNIS